MKTAKNLAAAALAFYMALASFAMPQVSSASESVVKQAELGWRIDWQANAPGFKAAPNPESFAVGPGGSNAPFDRRRLGYMMFDLSEYKNNLDALESIRFRVMTHSNIEANSKKCLQAHLLTPDQVDKIESFDVSARGGMTYAEAVNLGIAPRDMTTGHDLAEDDYRMLVFERNVQKETMYTSDNFVDSLVQYYKNDPNASGTVVVQIDTGDVTLAVSAAISIRGNAWPSMDETPALLIETKTSPDIMKIGNAVAEQLPKFTANDTIELPSSLDEFPQASIDWESLTPGVITADGSIFRPTFSASDQAARLKATVTSGGESWDFFYDILVFREGTLIGDGEPINQYSMQITFDGFTPSGQAVGHVLQIPNTYLEEGMQYCLKTANGENEIARFFAGAGGGYSSVDVSDYIKGGGSALLIESENAAIFEAGDAFTLRGIDSGEQSAIQVLGTLDLGVLSAVTEDITLPAVMDGIDLVWQSSNPSFLSARGRVDRPLAGEGDQTVSLTASCDVGGMIYSRTFLVKILCSSGLAYPELKDPMHMTDEAFFGKWDAQRNAWASVWNASLGRSVNAPALQYELNPALGTVERFVKEGNYAKAKEALLTYYRGRAETLSWQLPQTTFTDTANYLRTEMIKEKIYTFVEGGDPVGVIEVDDQWGWRTVDLRLNGTASFIKEAVSLIDSNMDGSTMQVYSHRYNDGEFAPYLEVVEDGATRILPVIADTYIKAGSAEQRNVNYGDSELLYCREEADLSDPLRPLPVSADTARPYFRFETSLLTGNVTSMKLKFYAKSDSPKQKIFVFSSPQEVGFNEKELTWIWRTTNVRHFTYVFNNKQTGWMFNMEKSSQNTGAPPNSVGTGPLNTSGSYYASQDYRSWNTTYEWINYNSRGYPIEWLIARYRLTGDESYAFSALEFLMALYTQSGFRTIDPYTSGEFAPQGTAYSRKLEGAWRTEYLCDLFFGTLSSDLMTPELLTAQLKYINAHMEYYLYAKPTTAANQNSAHRIAALRMQAYFPEMRTEEKWNEAKRRLKEHYIDGMNVNGTNLLPLANPDGSYTESTSGYMDGTVKELVQCLNMLKAYDGMDDPYYKMFMETYENIMQYMLNLCFPYGLSPGWGDSGRGGTKAFLKSMLENFDDPSIRSFVTGGAEGTVPAYTSKLFKDNGTVFLKDGWSSGSMAAFSNFMRGGSHSHSDALALDVSAYGVPLLVDGGNSSYSASDPMARSAAKALTHNVVEITNYDRMYHAGNAPGGDQESSSTSDVQRGALAANRMFDFVEMGSGPAGMPDRPNSSAIYKGYDSNRKVLFLHQKYWIVSDYIIPQDSTMRNTYSQAWHPNANEIGQRGSEDDINSAWTSWLYPGFDMAAPINKLTIDPKSKAMVTHLNGPNIKVIPADPEKLSAEKLQYYQATPRYGAIISNYVSYRQENVAGPVTYDTVLFPDKAGENTDVSVSRIELDVDPLIATALAVEIGLNTGTYYTSNELAPSVRRFGDFSTNGQMAYIESNARDEITMAALTKATTLSKGNTALISASEPIRDLGVRWSGSTLHLTSEDGTLPAGGVKIYSASEISRVTLNGQEVNYTYHDNLVATAGEPYTPPENPGPSPGAPDGSGNPGGNDNRPNPIVGGKGGGGGPVGPVVIPTPGPEPTETPSKTVFSDIDDHWGRNEILKLYERGIVKDNEDHQFRPDASITKAEFAAMLVRALELPQDGELTAVFSDVNADDWFAGVVEAAYNAGFIHGYEDGSFRPDALISREEMAAMLAAACGYLDKLPAEAPELSGFDDFTDISQWAMKSLKDVTALGLMQGDDNRLSPRNNATRAESAAVISRLLKIQTIEGE